MRVLYLIDSKRYKYHKELVNDFLSTVDGDVIDLSDESGDSKYNDIDKSGADVIITFDGIGLGYRTVMDTLSLNNIYARMAHILFHKPSFYGQMLNYRQNLSMFTYIPCTEDLMACREQYPDIPNLYSFGKFYYKADNEAERETDKNTISLWWEEFKREAML